MDETKIPFDKTPTTFTEQIQILLSKGLEIDMSQAERILAKMTYFRFSSYAKSFYKSGNFISGTRLDDIYQRYCFDRELKYIVFQGVEKFENAIKAQISERMSVLHGAHWYIERFHFDKLFRHEDFLVTVKEITNDPIEISSPLEISNS